MEIKAYIPPEPKTIGVGSWRWLTPDTPHVSLGDTNMLVSENAKTPDAKPKICVLPNAKPKRKPVEYRLRWVPTQNSGVVHVHFMFFVLISFALGSQREPSFQWNMGLSIFSLLFTFCVKKVEQRPGKKEETCFPREEHYEGIPQTSYVNSKQ